MPIMREGEERRVHSAWNLSLFDRRLDPMGGHSVSRFFRVVGWFVLALSFWLVAPAVTAVVL